MTQFAYAMEQIEQAGWRLYDLSQKGMGQSRWWVCLVPELNPVEDRTGEQILASGPTMTLALDDALAKMREHDYTETIGDLISALEENIVARRGG